MDVYAENILDHYRDPRGKKLITDASVEHEEINHACGDAITLFLKIEDGMIKEIGWEGEGCAISQAGMSILFEEIEGKTTEEVLKLSKDDIYDMLGVPIGPRRFKCALLCLHTVKNAIRKANGEDVQTWLETVEID